ncbi:MAG TPA: VOC family protein [Chitinophagaceae bacterium]|nr:VOC family protein [Chitinophagaceae bacterium]
MEQSIQLLIRGIQHVGIPVTDIRRSESFYEKLGFTNAMEASFDYHGETGTCIMMQRDNLIIELYQFPASELETIKNRKDGHIDHIAFDVADIDATFTTLKDAGFYVIEEAPEFLHFWKNGCRYFNITGPDGERLEFNQIL